MERRREVTLLPEWQWPSCIASLKRGWELGGVAECHFQVSSQHSSLMRDGFCSTDSQGDQEKGPSPPPLHPSTSQISDPPRSWQPKHLFPPAQPRSPNHHHNNKGRKISIFWFLSPSPWHVPTCITLNQNDHTFTVFLLIPEHPFLTCPLTLSLPSVREAHECYLATLASDSSIPVEGKGERRDLPGLLAAPICQMHPARWFTFTARIYGMPATKRVEAARIMGERQSWRNYSK